MRKASLFALIWLACSTASSEEPVKQPNATKAPAQADDAKSQLERKLVELQALQKEIKRLRAVAGATPEQILIRLQVLEISRTKLKELGYGGSEEGAAVVLSRAVRSGDAQTNPDARAAGPQELASATLSAGSNVKEVLDAWKEQGAVLRVIAEPAIATTSGRPASFRVGGEFPVPTVGRDNRTRTEYRFFGTKLDVTPMVRADGRIGLELRPCVSEIDEKQTSEIHGFKVPGLRIREIDTGVSLNPGETFAISGFRQDGSPTERVGQNKHDDDSASPTADEIEMLVVTNVDFIDAMTPAASDGGSHRGNVETPRQR